MGVIVRILFGLLILFGVALVCAGFGFLLAVCPLAVIGLLIILLAWLLGELFMSGY